MAVQTEEFRTAREFLEALRPSSERWIDAQMWSSTWIFRGQRDANWELTPSAWRPEVTGHNIWPLAQFRLTDYAIDRVVVEMRGMGIGASKEIVKSLLLTCRFEYASMMLYTNMADELGFRIPGG